MAEALSLGSSSWIYEGHLEGSSRLVGSCGGRGPERLFWIQAPFAGSWYFTTGSPETLADTVLYALERCEEAPEVELACNDDARQGETVTRFSSLLLLELEAQEEITLVVDSFGAEGGAFALEMGQPRVVPLGASCDEGIAACEEGLVCFGFQEDYRCMEQREQLEGELCDPEGRLGPCEEGLSCFGNPFEGFSCQGVRERVEGEPCDLQGELGPCAENLICVRGEESNLGSCQPFQLGEEGAPCDPEPGGVLLCDLGFICAPLGSGFSEFYCLLIEPLSEGAFCNPEDLQRPCAEGLACFSADETAPRCRIPEPGCPPEWPITLINLDEQGRWSGEGSFEGEELALRLCRYGEGPTHIYSFQPEEEGRYLFETHHLAERIDTLMELRRYCALGDPESLLACDDDSGAETASRIELELEAGAQLYLLIAQIFEQVGSYELRVQRLMP